MYIRHPLLRLAARAIALLVAITQGSFACADILSRIADDVVQPTTFEMPEAQTPPQVSRYNAWMYQNLMRCEGMHALGEVTGKERCKNYNRQRHQQ